VKIVRNDYI